VIDQELLSRIFKHETQYWSCLAAVEQRYGWVAFSNPSLITRIDPNHAGEFRATTATAAAIVDDIIEYYQKLGAVPAAYLDLLFAPQDLIVELQRANFQDWPDAASDLMIYTGPDVARPSSAPVEVVETDRASDEWASIVADHDSADEAARGLVRALYRAEIADPRITAYLARVDGQPAGRCELFSSDGLGRVEAVRTSSAYQRRGLAAAGIRRAVQDSLQVNTVTYIYAEPGGEAQHLYEQLGFKTVAKNAMRGFVWQA